MPKKGKKGGKKGKKGGGKKGKEGKKGDKSGKKDKKAKVEENIKKLAITNSSIWEARLEMMEKSRVEYRETMIRLAGQNSELHETLLRSEKDAIDVINYLKNELTDREEEINNLKEQSRELKNEQRKEKEQIIIEMSEQIAKSESEIKEKDGDIALLKNELKMVNEFRKNRNQLNAEFNELKEALQQSNKDHEEIVGKMERKFFEEKMRIQLEANKKISELADRAHKEAIENLNEATKSVFKENVRSNEALKYHVQNTEKQREKVKKLKEANKDLEAEKEMLDIMVSEKVVENKKLKDSNKELLAKVDLLEKALTQSVKEYDESNKNLRLLHENELDSSTKEIEKCQRLLDLRTQELKKIRNLAKQILHERSEVERFFLESLELVKKEILINQNQYKKDAQIAYQQKMKMAQAGKSEYPPIRTFGNSKSSTNSVYQDLEAAFRFINTTGKVDISDLTWEQRERVIRYLFTKMNTSSQALILQQSSSHKELNASSNNEDFKLPSIPQSPNKTPSPKEILQDELDKGDNEDNLENSVFVTQGLITEAS